MMAETAVGVPTLNKLLCVFLIDLHALALNIGTIGTADLIGALIGNNPCSIECAPNEVHCICNVAIAVSIFNTQDKRPVVCAGKQVRIERCTQVANVHISRRTRCKTGANLRICQLISSQNQFHASAAQITAQRTEHDE